MAATADDIRVRRMRGVFSTESSHYLGFGGTRRKVRQQIFVMAEELETGDFRIQRLNRNFLPSGPIRHIDREELLKKYVPEPSIYMNKVIPIMRRMEETVERGDRHRERCELFSAEFEYQTALGLDENHVRATFGLGLTYLERHEVESAELVFRKLIRLEAAFHVEHKHLFNEFGIQMRKLGMYPQAMKYYARAYHLSKDDEHLIYNMARTLYEKGSSVISRRFLEKALRMKPDFEECRQFLDYLDAQEAKTVGAVIPPPASDAGPPPPPEP
ncbi:tetratricopeptide repeat protein [Desulfolutivibrio sulfoxidireducens]|uniref:tetratricopeptide repeat protein n=1 Tax=Desulfolutivibrio sulfoxidireducens TaxID=2773299 RepID=UPI00159E9A03|nr:tetratricopeptide repeat protein [Desulfolutivibrio sulfoxidireducens]